LAAQVSEENYDKGLIYPPFTNIRKISANIAAKVAAKAYDLGEFLEMFSVWTTVVNDVYSFSLHNVVFPVWLDRSGFSSAKTKGSCQICRKLHVQPRLPKLPLSFFDTQ